MKKNTSWVDVLLVMGIMTLVVGGLVYFGPSIFLKIAGAEKVRMARRIACGNNLKQLWCMQQIYATKFGGLKKRMPHETGSAFWLKLSDPGVDLLDKESIDIYLCPHCGDEPNGYLGFDAACSYRGPKEDVNDLPDTAIVGCDKPENHAEGVGINVLRKSGDVQFVEPGNPLYQQALEQTCE